MPSTQVGISELNADVRLDLMTDALYKNVLSDILRDIDVFSRYADEEGIANILSGLNFSQFSCISANIQGLPNNNTEFINFMNKLNSKREKISCFSLQETWLKDSNLHLYSYPGYKTFFKCRTPGKDRGGVGLIINDAISCQLLNNEHFTDNILETICVKIKFGDFKAVLISLYRPPSHPNHTTQQSFELFITHFNNFLDYLDKINLPIILSGDFNLNLLTLMNENSNASLLNENLLFASFLQCITRVTRLQHPSFSLIDFVCLRDLIQHLSHTFVIHTDISDHFPVMCILNIGVVKRVPKPKDIKKRFYSSTNIENFRHALSQLDWLNVTELNDPNVCFAQFFNSLNHHLNEQIPLKSFRFNQHINAANPFMTPELLIVRADKHKLFIQSKNRDLSNADRLIAVAEYKRYRNYYSAMTRRAKKVYYKNKIIEAGKDGRKLWAVLREAMGLDSSKVGVERLIVDNVEITDPIQIANHFNSHSSSLGPSLTPQLPHTPKDFRDYLPPPAEFDFVFDPLTPLLVKDHIICMKAKTALDNNNLSMKLIRAVAQEISVPLCHIFNLSFSQGIFPDSQKISKSIPIHKGGDSTSLDNFRLVSIISHFSKIQERILYDRLFAFLDRQNFFFIRQFGFRPKHSTSHAILNLVNQVTASLVSGKMALAVLLDIRKCFDLIDRDILYVKLENYGVRGSILKWFKSYFSNRHQRVFVNGVFSSNLCALLIGVLQGSVLGVLLFIIFINDIYMCCPSIISNLFADDNVGLIIGKDIEEIVDIARRELPLLIEWYSSNRLLIHPGKTRGILFTSPRFVINLPYINNNLQFPVFIDMNNYDENLPDKIIPLNMVPNNDEVSCKFLGIQLDDKLNFKSHFKQLYIKITRAIYSIKQMRNILDRRHLKLLYNSYIRSNIEYACATFPHVIKSAKLPIFKCQKQVVRVLTNSNYNANTAVLFRQLEILPIEQLIEFNVVKFMFLYRQGLQPKVFDGVWLRNNHDNNNYRLRNADDFKVKAIPANALYLFNHPLYYYPRAWNRLPPYLKLIQNKNQFLAALHNHLLETVNH